MHLDVEVETQCADLATFLKEIISGPQSSAISHLRIKACGEDESSDKCKFYTAIEISVYQGRLRGDTTGPGDYSPQDAIGDFNAALIDRSSEDTYVSLAPYQQDVIDSTVRSAFEIKIHISYPWQNVVNAECVDESITTKADCHHSFNFHWHSNAFCEDKSATDEAACSGGDKPNDGFVRDWLASDKLCQLKSVTVEHCNNLRDYAEHYVWNDGAGHCVHRGYKTAEECSDKIALGGATWSLPPQTLLLGQSIGILTWKTGSKETLNLKQTIHPDTRTRRLASGCDDEENCTSMDAWFDRFVVPDPPVAPEVRLVDYLIQELNTEMLAYIKASAAEFISCTTAISGTLEERTKDAQELCTDTSCDESSVLATETHLMNCNDVGSDARGPCYSGLTKKTCQSKGWTSQNERHCSSYGTGQCSVKAMSDAKVTMYKEARCECQKGYFGRHCEHCEDPDWTAKYPSLFSQYGENQRRKQGNKEIASMIDGYYSSGCNGPSSMTLYAISMEYSNAKDQYNSQLDAMYGNLSRFSADCKNYESEFRKMKDFWVLSLQRRYCHMKQISDAYEAIMEQIQVDHADPNLTRWRTLSESQLEALRDNQWQHSMDLAISDVCISQMLGVADSIITSGVLDEGVDTCVRREKTPIEELWSSIGELYQACSRNQDPAAAQTEFNNIWSINALSQEIMDCPDWPKVSGRRLEASAILISSDASNMTLLA